MGNKDGFLNTEYISDFESDDRSETASLYSFRTEDDSLSEAGYGKRKFSDLNPATNRKIVEKPRPTGSRMEPMNAYERHMKMVNNYIMYYGGSKKDLVRDASKDKRDIDVIKENSRFVWEEGDNPQSWEERLSKRYWDRLFKEYCIADLARYKENKLGLRWRSEKEVVSGKGQFVCGSVKCADTMFLRSWEVNFSYTERGEKRNALIKLRLCPACSHKLNYHKQHAEVVGQPNMESQVNAEDADEDLPDSKRPHKTEPQSRASSSTEPVAPQPLPSAPTVEDEFDDYLKSMFM